RLHRIRHPGRLRPRHSHPLQRLRRAQGGGRGARAGDVMGRLRSTASSYLLASRDAPPARCGTIKKASRAARLLHFGKRRAAYAATSAASSLACLGPESLPFSLTSRSTNSITATGALSP